MSGLDVLWSLLALAYSLAGITSGVAVAGAAVDLAREDPNTYRTRKAQAALLLGIVMFTALWPVMWAWVWWNQVTSPKGGDA